MISLIIPTHNDEARLVNVLTPLVPASIEGLIRELIVVDAASTDATLEIAEDAGALIVTGGLDAAISAAKGPWIMMLEPVVILQPGWDDAVRAHLASRRTAARFQLKGNGLFKPRPVATLALKEAWALGGVGGGGLQERRRRIGKVNRLADGGCGLVRR
jgi:glycosyltransferase involved in cell wall biosynthesis